MWERYDARIGAPYSFSNAKLTEDVRASRTGGLTTILTNRHVEIGVPAAERTFDETVYTVPNGDMITDVISYDFNNLYGSGLMFSLLKYFNILILTLTVMR